MKSEYGHPKYYRQQPPHGGLRPGLRRCDGDRVGHAHDRRRTGTVARPATVDLRADGTMDIDFGEEGLAGGAIIDLVPGSPIEYEWRFPGEPDSIVRFDLEALDDGRTRLRLHHRRLPSDQAVGYGAGWYAHLDQLADALTGGADFNWIHRFNQLLPEYRSGAVV